MADDWRPGDLALCVKDRWSGVLTRRQMPEGFGPRAGGVYTVVRVVIDPRGMTALVFEHWSYTFAARCFRKINPHTPDAEDEETIRLLNGAPAEETEDA